MDKEKASREIMELFIRVTNKYNALEKIPARHGTKYDLYHSERHILDTIGDRPGLNVTELAGVVGVTKGAISQIVRKLESKGFARRYKKSTNDKEVFIELTRAGTGIHETRRKINKETVMPLVEELERYPDDKVAFLVSMFRWLDAFMDDNSKRMGMRKKAGK
jgi:DNA-binding MarR family transcriptional regulator